MFPRAPWPMATTPPTATGTPTHLRGPRALRYNFHFHIFLIWILTSLLTFMLMISGSLLGRDESSDVPSSHPRGKGQVRARQYQHHQICCHCNHDCHCKEERKIITSIAQLPEDRLTRLLPVKYCSRVDKRAQNYPQLSGLRKSTVGTSPS